jgi:DNA-binding response OmpR family regulator
MSTFAGVLDQPRLAHATTSKRQTILIVDDDEALTDFLSRRLRQQGFDTITASGGCSGMAIARSDRPALIVLDLRLPDADGLSVCQQLADSPETWSIPVIILSGLEQPDILRRCRSAGCQYFVRKPYDPSALLVLIRHALRAADAGDDFAD